MLQALGITSSMLGHHKPALQALEEALQLMRRSASARELQAVRLSLLNAQGRYMHSLPKGPGRERRGRALLQGWEVLLRDARADHNQRLILIAQGNRAITLEDMGEYAAACAVFEELLPQQRASGLGPSAGNNLRDLGHCQLQLQRFEAARASLEESVTLLRAGGSLGDLAASLESLALAREHCEDLRGALDAFKELRQVEKRQTDEAAHQALRQRELALELAQLTNEWAKQAQQDALTGLANRRALQAWEEARWRERAEGEGFALVMVDLDHFKSVNDRFGHGVGDQVLQQVAELMRQHSRAQDLAARVGGEELVLGLARLQPEGAAAVAERLRAAIAAHPWAEVQAGLQLTASLGVAHAREVHSLAELTERADARLYAAKHGGRNQVVAAG
ncbi:MAG: GGDEF domain-containing protein [Inhella sp.]